MPLECVEFAAALRRAVAAGAEIELSTGVTSSDVVIRDPIGQRWALIDRRHLGLRG
jgi:hypothetical protein